MLAPEYMDWKIFYELEAAEEAGESVPEVITDKAEIAKFFRESSGG